MRLYKKEEIINKHGQYIVYWSNQQGNTELEKFRNLKKVTNNDSTEYIIPDKTGNDIVCIVDNRKGPDGHILVCFNNLGETILNTDDCYGNDRLDVIESLEDNKIT